MLTIGTMVEALANEMPVLSGPANLPLAFATHDSRSAGPDSLFVAFAGESADGHDYVDAAFAAGARVALVNRPVSNHPVIDMRAGLATTSIPDQPFLIQVADTMAGLQQVARHYRRGFDVRIIGITGSVGKTSTKELAYSVLAQQGSTLKSQGNFNNEIGLPLTLLELRDHHERVVLEMGMYALGEIALLCQIAQPHVGVVTNVAPVHLSRLGTIENILAAKRELVEALPGDGTAILNMDDDRVMTMVDHTEADIFTYGLDDRADLWADDIESMGLEGINFTLNYEGDRLALQVPLIGLHSVHTALRAAAVGLVEGMAWDEIVTGLKTQSSQLRLVTVEGPQNSLVIDDSYNASPESVIAALNLLSDLDGRRIAVLGDMLELGSEEERGHRLVGGRAALVADELVVVGQRGRMIGEEALAAGLASGNVHFAADAPDATPILQGLIQANDIILVKGSLGMRMDRIVAELRQVS